MGRQEIKKGCPKIFRTALIIGICLLLWLCFCPVNVQILQEYLHGISHSA